MLSTDPIDQGREVRASMREIGKAVKQVKKLVTAYHSPAYTGSDAEGDPENASYEFQSLWLATAVSGIPRVKIGTKKPGTQRLTARAIHHGVNRKIRDADIEETLDESAIQFGFGWVGALTTLKREPSRGPDNDDPPLGPVTDLLDWEDCIWDTQATSLRKVRYTGHKFREDIDDLIARAEREPDEKWRVEVLRKLSEDVKQQSQSAKRQGDEVNRKQVELVELYVGELDIGDVLEGADPSETRENGYNGVIFTLSLGKQGGSAEWVRDPRAYYGPRWGPYHFWGDMCVPGSTVPLSVLLATDQLRRDLNAHSKANNEAHNQAKTLYLFDERYRRDSSKINAAKHGTAVGVQDFDRSKMERMEFPGPSPDRQNAELTKRDRLRRAQGISDAQAGNPQDNVTATADALASQATNARMGKKLRRFQKGWQRIFQTWAWYLYHDDDIAFPLGEEAAEEFQQEEPWFYGGDGRKAAVAHARKVKEREFAQVMPGIQIPSEILDQLAEDAVPRDAGHGVEEEGSGATFDDLELEIEFYSMARMSEGLQVRQATTVLELATKVAPLVPQAPFIDWETVFDMYGDAVNIPNLGDILNPKLAMKMAGLNLAIAAQAKKQENERPEVKSQAGVHNVLPKPGQMPRQDMQGPQSGAMAGAGAKRA